MRLLFIIPYKVTAARIVKYKKESISEAKNIENLIFATGSYCRKCMLTVRKLMTVRFLPVAWLLKLFAMQLNKTHTENCILA